MIKAWHDRAWEEYQQWLTADKKIIKRINALIKVESDQLVILQCGSHYED